MRDFSHLNDETNNFLNRTSEIGSNKKKKQMLRHWILRVPHFVFHSKAQQCINQIQYIFQQTIDIPHDEDFDNVFEGVLDTSFQDRLLDMEGMTITGEGGTGKTFTIQEFIRLKKRIVNSQYEHHPVEHVILKDSITGLKGLYSSLLAPFNSPYANPNAVRREKVTIDTMEQALIHTLRVTKTKLLFIDDFQHALGKNRQPIINQLKRTMIVSQVPFILVGTPEVWHILGQDPQLADRCPIKDYSRYGWTFNNDEYRDFLRGYEEYFPFPEQSELFEEGISTLIFEKVQYGNLTHPEDLKIENPSRPRPPNATSLRRLVGYLKKLASIALMKNQNKVTRELIIETPP
ncbi:MAG: TniB family NTP-binding protein [Candidatus Helarchaeota archaeon]